MKSIIARSIFFFISSLMLFIPFIAVTINYQIYQFERLPSLLLDSPFFYFIADYIALFAPVSRTSLSTIIYFLLVSLIIILFRSIFINKAVRAMLGFYKNSYLRIIPNILISTISLSLFMISVYYRNPLAFFEINIIWFDRYLYIFSLFFLTLALFFTSSSLLKIKLTIKKQSYQLKSKKMSFLFICNLFYSLILLLIIESFHSFFILYSSAKNLLFQANFLNILLYSSLFFLLAGVILNSLRILEEKKLPITGILLTIVCFLCFYFFIHIIVYEEDYSGTDKYIPEPVNRIVVIDDKAYFYEYPDIDLYSFLNSDNMCSDFETLKLAEENLLSKDDMFRFRLNTLFGLHKVFPRIHQVSDERLSLMVESLFDENHNLFSGFHLINALKLIGFEEEAEYPIYHSIQRLHDTAVKHNLPFSREITTKAISIKELALSQESLNTFHISGNILFDSPSISIDTASLDIYISIIQNIDFEYIIHRLNDSPSPVSSIWKFCDPFTVIDNSSFTINNIIDFNRSYRFVIIIDDRNNSLRDAGLKDIRSNLYNIAINPAEASEYTIHLYPIFTEITDNDSE